MEEELKKALDRCKELEQSSVPAVDGVDIFECYEQEKEEYLKQVIKWYSKECFMKYTGQSAYGLGVIAMRVCIFVTLFLCMCSMWFDSFELHQYM